MSDTLQFTAQSSKALREAVKKPEIGMRNAGALILRELYEHHRPIPFGGYLRRYIIRRAGLPETASVGECAAVLRSSFREYGVPASFSDGTVRLGTFAGNCLTRQSVSRESVFLLGFGLRMSVEDVNTLLVRALHEREIYFKDPVEAISWYCFENRYGFEKFRQMTERFERMERAPLYSLFEEDTGDLKRYLVSKASGGEERFLQTLTRLKAEDGASMLHKSVRREYEALLRETRRIVGSAKLRKTTGNVAFEPDEVTAAEIENALYPTVPKDGHGNLPPEKASSLYPFFSGVRLSRQRLGKLGADAAAITRFDLMTLTFFIHGSADEIKMFPEERVAAFTERVNAVLRRAGLWELYPAHPYEAFLLLCSANRQPLEVFKNVIGSSYASGASF